MLPYEILVGLKKTMYTRSCGFIVKQISLKQLNVNKQNVHNLSTIVPQNKFTLKLSYNDITINNTKRFHTHLSNRCKILSREEVAEHSMHDKFKRKKKPTSSNINNVDNESIEEIPIAVRNWLFTEAEKSPVSNIYKKFPEPKVSIQQIFDIVQSELKFNCLSLNYTAQKKSKWICTYEIKWPENRTFKSLGSSKISAGSSAALKCVYWLHLIKKVKNRMPIIYDETAIKSIIQSTEELKIENSVLEEVNDFLNQYEIAINKHISENNFLEKETKGESLNDVNIIDDNYIFESRKSKIQRNKYLKEMLKNKNNHLQLDLPIFQYKSQILEELENNRALVIKGDTGCGKSTQVPQFIIDHMISNDLGSNCNMIVTQPRRISAITLAERIAFERNENLGNVVGYQVHLNQILPKKSGSLLLCTTGILLKRLQSNPELSDYSHVIIDEAHERTIDTDMLLILLKRVLEKNSSLKLIVMSATLNANLFQEYLNCNAIEIPGRLFSVKMNFLEDINKLNPPVHYQTKTEEDDEPSVNYELITNLIRWISKHKPPGAILCFLPGWSDISCIQYKLNENPIPNQVVIPLHSKLNHSNQKLIFNKTSPISRKIILSTDVAETGITVPDVVYVIDSACHKIHQWNENKGLSSVNMKWISQANLNQRKGRAGRITNGESYHLITKQKFYQLNEYPIPEVSRISLERSVLDGKIHSNEKAETFLGSMIQPPRISAINKAVYDLQILGALDENENLTPLGKKLTFFSTDPKLSKAIIYSSFFQCLRKVLTIASAISLDSGIFYERLGNSKNIRENKLHFHLSSDHISLANIYEKWTDCYLNDPESIQKFCKDNFLMKERMRTLYYTVMLQYDIVTKAGLINYGCELTNEFEPEENSFAHLNELVLGVLLGGTDQLLQNRNFEVKKGRFTKNGFSLVTEDYQRAQINSESVNYKKTSWKSPYLVYFQKTHDIKLKRTMIYDSSIISPLTVLLFSQGEVYSSKLEDDNGNNVLLTVDRKKNLRLTCDKNMADSILRFRNVMWSIICYYIQSTNYELNLQDLSKIHFYRKKMMNVLIKLLTPESKSIDSENLK